MLAATAFSTGSAKSIKNDPGQLIRDVEGVYKQTHHLGNVDGDRYDAEDVVEIVQDAPDRIYFRAELNFYNGHTCSINGIAALKDDAFIYHAPKDTDASDAPCTLAIRLTDKDLVLYDRAGADSSSTCRDHCGMRGTLSGYTIPRNKKRVIKYMKKLLASDQYKQAVEEFGTLPKP